MGLKRRGLGLFFLLRLIEQDFQELQELLEKTKKQHQIDLATALELLEKDIKEAHETLLKKKEEKWATDMEKALEAKDIVHLIFIWLSFKPIFT